MKGSDDLIELRAVQHFLYCPHRWGLIEIACDWAENFFISKASLVHERIDRGKMSASAGKICERSVRVFDDGWKLYGVLDCLELSPDPKGCFLSKYGGNYRLTIVEYKPASPKQGGYRREDALQLLAQKICVDSVFGTECDACFYYADTRKRERVAFAEPDYTFLEETLERMRSYLSGNEIPPIRSGQYCSGCSMKDICLPKGSEA